MPTLSVNGVGIHYEEWGEGHPVLCIHGAGGTALSFSGAAREIARFGRALTYDRRGCGRSGRPEPYERTSVSEHAADAAGLLAALDAAPAVVIGRSYGGTVGVDLARRHPDLVRALALLEPDAPRELAPGAAAWLDGLADRLRAVADRAGVDAVPPALIAEVAGEEGWEALPVELRDAMSGNGRAILAEICGEWWPAANAAELAAVDHPTLLVAAADSPPEFHEPIEVLAGALPEARTELVDGGHLIDPAHPLVLDFVREQLGAGA